MGRARWPISLFVYGNSLVGRALLLGGGCKPSEGYRSPTLTNGRGSPSGDAVPRCFEA